MINRKNRITNVQLTLSGESLDNTIVEKQHNGSCQYSVPFQFQYSGSWDIHYECKCCYKQNSFGLYFNSSISPYSNLTYEQTQYLCSKYYKVSILEMISKLFHKTSLISNELGSFIIFDNNFDSDFPVTSSIQPILFSCKKCNTEYLSLMRNRNPYSADKEFPYGIIGTIFVDEIIQIESAKKFIHLLEEFKVV